MDRRYSHLLIVFRPIYFSNSLRALEHMVGCFDSISVYIEPSPVSLERSPGSLVKRCPAKLVGGRVVRWSWVNFQGQGVLLIWIIVWQGPTTLAVGAGGICVDILTFFYLFTSLSPSL